MAAIALTIAGSDSGGGAGIQADLKAMSALGVFGTSVVTAVTAQNTLAVTAVQAIDLPVISAQITAVRTDFEIGAVKIGMLASSEIIETVLDALAGFAGPIVIDPVMVAKSGDALLADDATETLRRMLLPRASLLTPNLPEAAKLLGEAEAQDARAMIEQGRALCDLGAQAVLMKGGHAEGPDCLDLLVGRDGEIARLSAPRIATRNTHGTGCTLSAAIAAGLAKGLPLFEAVKEAHEYLQGAIRAADRLNIGKGHGPVHHFHAIWEA